MIPVMYATYGCVHLQAPGTVEIPKNHFLPMGEILQHTEYPYWLGLLRIPGIGAITCRRLLEHFGNPESIFSADRVTFEQLGLSRQTIDSFLDPEWQRIEADLTWLSKPGHHLVTLHDPRYPALLKEIPDAPPVLFATGNLDLLNHIQIAVVGSRNPSIAGRRLASEFSSQLAGFDLTITSGLALGVDYCSHTGALAVNGNTVAVLGNGPDKIYPARHKELARRIAESGLVVTEFPVGTSPLPENFPRRNRIISGMSVGVLVVEAAIQSGSLITARHAMEQGREVFAIPGSIHNPLARGCHALIRQGAKLVESVHDILEELAPFVRPVDVQSCTNKTNDDNQSGLDPDYQLLLNTMGDDPVTVDMLVERSGLTAEVVSSMLLILDLKGIVDSGPGGIYTRTR